MKRSCRKAGQDIPYEQIDCEIRPLIRLINEFPGIRTEFSCVGHKEEEEGYVTFCADSQEDLTRLLAALPFLSWRANLVLNQLHWRAVLVDVAVQEDQSVRYNLRFSGRPQHVQRRLIAEMEQALAAALAKIRA